MNEFEQNNQGEEVEREEIAKPVSEVNFGGKTAASEINTEINVELSTESAEYKEYVFKRKFNRNPLIIAMLGLVFSVLYGLGGILGVIALVKAVSRYRVHKSEPLKWAIVMSITCILFSLAFIIAVVGAAVYASIYEIEVICVENLIFALI